LSSKFAKNWEDEKGGIRAAIRPPSPLKTKIEMAVRRIEAQIQYLESALNRLTDRDKYLFSKVVDAYSKHDIQRANVFANELAELRKLASFMMNGELALERVVLRLRTVSQLGNIVVTLAPATKVLQSVSSGVAGILPNAEKELGQVGIMLNEIIVEAGQTSGVTPDFDIVSEDAQKILNEAALVTEQRMREKFPELPAIRSSELGLENRGEDVRYTNY